MARENTAILYGWIASTPRTEVTEDGRAECSMDVLAVRRSFADEDMRLRGRAKEDYIPLFSRNRALTEFVRKSLVPPEGPELYAPDEEDGEYLGYMVIVKGTLCTEFRGYLAECPHCGAFNDRERQIAYVNPIFIRKCGFGIPVRRKRAEEILRDHSEVSNTAMLYGTLCREPEYYAGGATELRFPVFSVRKRHIFDDPEDRRVDYPWVRSFGPKNGEYAGRVREGSSVYINGALQHRRFEGQTVACGECGEPFDVSGEATEVVPYAMKYRKNCGREGEDPEAAAKLGAGENTVILYGWVCAPPKVSAGADGNAATARLPLRVYRRKYDSEDPMRKGEADSDTVIVKTSDPGIARHIQDRIAAEPGTEKGRAVHMGYIVLVKGTVSMQTVGIERVCPECGGRFIGKTGTACVDPAGIWAEEGPFGEREACRILRESAEISNMAWVHGELAGWPDFLGDGREECSFGILADRLRNPAKGKVFPRVVVRGRKAAECGEALHEGSVVFVNAAMRTVTYADRAVECPLCGADFAGREVQTELVPYQVEYHADCVIPEPSRAGEEEDECLDQTESPTG